MYITIHEPQGKRIFRSRQTFKEYLSQFIQIEAAGGMVLNGKGELLMMFRRGKWDMPKGKLDEGETIKECAQGRNRTHTSESWTKITSHLSYLCHQGEKYHQAIPLVFYEI
jgi:hypothetical protein